MNTYIVKFWTGPCTVSEIAARMRAAAAPNERVAIEGTEHVYVHIDARHSDDMLRAMAEWPKRAGLDFIGHHRIEILRSFPYTNAPAAAPDTLPIHCPDCARDRGVAIPAPGTCPHTAPAAAPIHYRPHEGYLLPLCCALYEESTASLQFVTCRECLAFAKDIK